MTDYPRIYIFNTYTDTASGYTTNGMTLGDDYITFRIPDSLVNEKAQSITISQFPSKQGQIFRWDQYERNLLKFQGFVKETSFGSTVTVKAACEEYYNRAMELGTSPEGLMVKFNSTTYDKTVDDSHANPTVYRGALETLKCTWTQDEALGFYIYGEFKVVWQ